MKKSIFTIVLACVALIASAQIKKPELMVVPSDVWCITNGYYTEVENMGMTTKVPNYKQALQENMGLKLAIAKLNAKDIMGFCLIDLVVSGIIICTGLLIWA